MARRAQRRLILRFGARWTDGATRFKCFAALDDGGTAQTKGATVRFLVFTQSPYAENTAPGAVAMAELGFAKAQVRDLWQRQDLGTFSSFAPQIAPHGAALYRISPQ